MSSGPETFSYEQDDAYEALVADERIFQSGYRFLIFCASLGYNRNRRVHDYNENGEMRWSYINQDPVLSVMSAALAYAATEEPDVMMEPETQIDIIVQYGAGGSRLLQERVIDQPGDNLDLLVELLQEERDREEFSDRVDVISEIEKEISSL